MVLDGIVRHAERVRGVCLVVVLHVGSDRDRDVERGVVGEHRVEAVPERVKLKFSVKVSGLSV